jgi:hypothetical protein
MTSSCRLDSRPNNHSYIESKLEYFISSKKIPNIIFHGAAGSGKRTLLDNFLYKIYQGNLEKMKKHIMTVECSHGKGIKFIREDLKFFAKSHIQSNQGSTFKSIVLLNADSLTIDAQSALRRCIELFSHNTRFFIVVENKERLLNPILSRFCEIYVSPFGLHATGSSAVEDTTQDAMEFREPTCWHLFQTIYEKYDGIGTEFSALVPIATDWCEQGYSCLDWIHCLQVRISIPESEQYQEISYRRNLISMCFYKIKPDFRCEKLLMYYLLYFTFVSSNAQLENVLL